MGPGPFDPSELSGPAELSLLLLGTIGVLLLLTAVLWLWDRFRGPKEP